MLYLLFLFSCVNFSFEGKYKPQDSIDRKTTRDIVGKIYGDHYFGEEEIGILSLYVSSKANIDDAKKLLDKLVKIEKVDSLSKLLFSSIHNDDPQVFEVFYNKCKSFKEIDIKLLINHAISCYRHNVIYLLSDDLSTFNEEVKKIILHFCLFDVSKGHIGYYDIDKKYKVLKKLIDNISFDNFYSVLKGGLEGIYKESKRSSFINPLDDKKLEIILNNFKNKDKMIELALLTKSDILIDFLTKKYGKEYIDTFQNK